MTFNSMSRVFGIASFLLQLLFRFVFLLFLCLYLFCFASFFFLLNSAIVSHHLLGQSGSFFKQVKAEVDLVRYSKVPVTSLR